MALSPSSGYQARRLWIAKYTLCVIVYKLTSELGKRVFAHGNTEYDTLFPSLLYTLGTMLKDFSSFTNLLFIPGFY